MEKLDLIIRPMKVSDLNKVSMIHSESFPLSRSTRLGASFVRRMYQWYILEHPSFSFVAISDDEIVGFLTGSIGGVTRRFRYTFWHIVWGFLSHPFLFLRSEMFASWKSHLRGMVPGKRKTQLPGDKGQAVVVKVALDSIGVVPSVRGKSVGRSLVSAFEQSAWDKNATILGLGVESDNLVARRLYEQCGWRLMHDDVEHNSANYVKELR